MRRRLALVLIGLCIGSGAAGAQVCFRGGPRERCRSFLLTELGARYNPTRRSAGTDFSNRLNVPLTAGWMANVGSRGALGATVGLEPDTEYSDWFFSFGPRYGRWLSRTTRLDGMVSLTVGRDSLRSISVQAVAMYRDLIGVDAGLIFDRVDDAYARPGVRPFFGARVGSYAGVLGYAATAVLFALFSSISND
jgi:hypothetical protein